MRFAAAEDRRDGGRPPVPNQSVKSVQVSPVGGPLVRYEIRVEGHLSETLANAFPELDHVVMSGQTVLFGTVVDEAHLYGLLTRCQSLGLRVMEMRQVPE